LPFRARAEEAVLGPASEIDRPLACGPGGSLLGVARDGTVGEPGMRPATASRTDVQPREAELISVIVPVYNAMPMLAEQLEALSKQTYRGPWELIIADNGSSDGSREIAEAWRSRIPSLRVVDASARRGPATARNVGVEAATGGLLAFCDAD